jgi:catechol 2,3-dioxygenase-like lactoylglutathione lyase family enzyme
MTMAASIQGVHPVLAARDVTASIDFFRRLGFQLSFQDHGSAPKYAAVQRDGIELHIQWADPDQWAYPVDRPAYRFAVSNVDDLYAEFVASGGIPETEGRESPWSVPANSPWGTREFHLHDPGRNGLQFYRPL